MPGEYVEIRCSFLSDKDLADIFRSWIQKFKKHLLKKKIDADAYNDVLLMREL